MNEHALRGKDYDLIITVYHAAQSEDICRQYMDDAAQFFKEAKEQNQQRVRRGKDLLNQRL